jgi:hypothetical protein
LRSALVIAVIVSLLIPVVCHAGAEVARKCNLCGQTIAGACFETKGVFYHPNHFTCHYCSDPINGHYTTYRSDNYHNRCFEDHIARRCTLCSGTIEGHYLVDYWGNAYHARHEEEVPSCDFCDRLITDDLYTGGVKFSDGRTLCSICHDSAVKKLAAARLLMSEVAARLRRIGMDFDLVDLQLHLVGLDRMQEIANFRSHDLRGFTDYHEEKNLFGRTKKRQIDVYLLYGMPRVEMISTIAHELTHVWQFLNGRLDNDPALSEGSCNFAAYWVLKRMAPSEESDFIIESMLRDDNRVYGEGFRRVKRYVESNGLSSWLALMTDRDPLLPR